ncbi:MAG: PQQ-binding-like beta-propeller repeat protein [Gemmataceae bacterium]
MRSLISLALLAAVAAAAAADWTVFRGTPGQTGVAASKLPAKLAELWKFTAEDSFENGVAVAGDAVFAPCMDEHLYALELKTGKLRWKYKGGPFKAAPAVKGGQIRVGDLDGAVHAVDAMTGTAAWKFDAGAEVGGVNFHEDLTLVPSHNAKLFAVDRAGKERWSFKTDDAIHGSVAVSQGKTFVVGCDSKMRVIDLATGKEDRAVDLESQTAGTAAVVGDVAYIGTMGSQVKAIDWKKGEVVWVYKPRRGDGFYSSAAVTDKYVIIGGRDRRVHCIDRKTGAEVWTFLTENKVDSSPVVADDRVVVGSMDEHLYVLDLNGGKELQKLKLDGPVSASPVVVEGRVLIGTQRGTLYCLGEK